VFWSASRAYSRRIGRSRIERQYWRQYLRSWLLPIIAVVLVAAGALVFDAVTPELVSVTLFYVAVVLIGFWFPQPKAALALGLLATPLIIIGYWIAIPESDFGGAAGRA
jgi:ABC-type Co2+ transport system permease subunit